MLKRIIIHSIKSEKTRQKLQSLVSELDSNCIHLHEMSSTAFRSDKNKDELHKTLVLDVLDPNDSAWIFTITESFTGFGPDVDALKEFMSV